jgi:hypothetical protein
MNGYLCIRNKLTFINPRKDSRRLLKFNKKKFNRLYTSLMKGRQSISLN